MKLLPIPIWIEPPVSGRGPSDPELVGKVVEVLAHDIETLDKSRLSLLAGRPALFNDGSEDLHGLQVDRSHNENDIAKLFICAS
jgi:hypothetical protein